VNESVRAKLRILVKKILKKHGYPPDKQEKGHANDASTGGIAV
jgi:DNA-binding LacI/PurR family transcriptional regulator